jgi:cell division transport system ATP-binding protein
LEKINSLGTTIIMATHDEKLVDRLKKRVIRLEKGQVVSDKKGGKYRG